MLVPAHSRRPGQLWPGLLHLEAYPLAALAAGGVQPETGRGVRSQLRGPDHDEHAKSQNRWLAGQMSQLGTPQPSHGQLSSTVWKRSRATTHCAKFPSIQRNISVISR